MFRKLMEQACSGTVPELELLFRNRASRNVPGPFSEPILTLFSAFLTVRYATLRDRFLALIESEWACEFNFHLQNPLARPSSL